LVELAGRVAALRELKLPTKTKERRGEEFVDGEVRGV